MSNAIWHLATANLPLETVIDGRYLVIAQTTKYVVLERAAKDGTFPSQVGRSHGHNALTRGKEFRVTRKMVEGTLNRLRAGERLHKQASAPKGGISYTVAIARGVAAALGSLIRLEGDHYVSTETQAQRKQG